MKQVRLVDAPIGLFRCNGILALKTEYGTEHNRDSGTIVTPDCYIVNSGEYFWGQAKTTEERNNLMVEPIPLHRVYIMGPNIHAEPQKEDQP